MAFTLATGYGRTSSMDGIADKQMSELSCHAKGAYFLFPKVHTVIDIGGQDVKVLRVEDGVMTNFQMNDKCAAGTGRFLDVMARVLEVEVSDLRPSWRYVQEAGRNQFHLYGFLQRVRL